MYYKGGSVHGSSPPFLRGLNATQFYFNAIEHRLVVILITNLNADGMLELVLLFFDFPSSLTDNLSILRASDVSSVGNELANKVLTY